MKNYPILNNMTVVALSFRVLQRTIQLLHQPELRQTDHKNDFFLILTPIIQVTLSFGGDT